MFKESLMINIKLMNTYIHSYQYVPIDILKNISLKFDNEYFIVNRKTGDKVIGLKNIPTDQYDIYNVYLSKLLNKKKSNVNKRKLANTTCNQINICIYVEVNYDNLVNFMTKFKRIPSNDNFFLLLKRNFLSEVNQDYSITNLNSNNLNIESQNMDPNIFSYKNVLFDFINSRYFLNNEEYELFRRSNRVPKKERFMFSINDFDVKTKKTTLNPLNKQKLIICPIKNINSWIENTSDYYLIENLNFNSEVLKRINTSEIVVLPVNFLYSNKYKSFFQSILGTSVYLSESIYNDYLVEYIQQKRDPDNNISNLILQIKNWSNIILDVSLTLLKENRFLNEMIKLFSCGTFVYYCENKKTQITYDFVRKMLNNVLNINIGFLNNYLLDKYKQTIIYNQSSKKYTNSITIRQKKLELGEKEEKYLKTLDLNKQIKYICFPNIVKGERFKILKKKETHNCTICLEKTKDNNLAVTECGHYFCYSCITRNFVNSSYCPNCRKKLTKNDIYRSINFTKLSYIKENNKVRDILNFEYDIILTKYTENLDTISLFLSDHNVSNSLIGNKIIIKNKHILIDDYENLNNLKTMSNLSDIESVLLLEPLYNNDRYYKYQINNVFKNTKTNITCYTYNITNLSY